MPEKTYEGKSDILLMAEILHHLGDVSQTLEIWDKLPTSTG